MDRKKEIIQNLKSQAPLIYDVVMTYDMGYEFSAITNEGVIFPMPGMLIDCSTKGHMPKWFSGTIKKTDFKKAEKFFNNLNVTPYEELSIEDLKNILSEVETIDNKNNQ